MNSGLIQELFSGPIDILGDIHGEIDPLRDLFAHLGYDEGSVHPQGRRLVFIGDLTDRGPDRAAVIELVSGLLSRGLAQCVRGNHELNLLREVRKEGNGWYFDDNHDCSQGKFCTSRPLEPDRRPAVRKFFCGLPLALERSDLRVVHAAWHSASVDEIRWSSMTVLELYNERHIRAVRLGEDTGLAERAEAETESLGHRLTNLDGRVPMLTAVAALDALYQDANPVRIVTSGSERVAEDSCYVSGKWRMVKRFPWWDEYREEIPVIIGHYWRWPTDVARHAHSRGEPDLFKEHAVHHRFGAARNVFCVDFAVGARYKERLVEATAVHECRLAAVQWPERELVFDHGVNILLADG